MLPVEILPVQETIVLRARGSELLILPQHVKKLQDMTKPRDFSQYFRAEALVNRPARKLFEAWLRKDHTLWPRLYQTVHKEMEAATGDDAPKTPKKEKAAPAAKAKAEVEAPKAKAKAEEKPAKESASAKATADKAPKAEKKDDKKEKKADKEPKKAAAKEKAPAKEKEAKAKPKAKAAAGGKKKG